LGAALLVVATHSGRTALVLSKHRNATPTLALTDDQEVARAMALYWGVTALHIPDLFKTNHVLAWVAQWCRTNKLIVSGDRVVTVRGVIPNNPNHNALLVYEVE
jgi:pyruvate kinase